MANTTITADDRKQVFDYLSSRIGKSAADDVTQEVLLKVWQTDTSTIKNRPAFLMVVAKSVLVSYIRSERVVGRSSLTCGEYVDAPSLGARFEPANLKDSSEPWTHASLAERAGIVRDAVDKLPEAEREAITEHYLTDGHQPSTANTAVYRHRAKAKLTASLAVLK